ncbi:MAG: acyl carrier protein, partial [Candidatus Eremiobacterota bacterium]
KLRKKGYFFGGYIPRWFNSDSILMQKNRTLPDVSNINLYSEKAKKILSLIRSDWNYSYL